MSDLLNILSNSNKDIDNQQLMDYLSGKLSGEAKHDVERWLVDNDFGTDAVEGLQQVKSQKNLDAYVEQLNNQLKQYLDQKKRRRERRKIKEIPVSYLAIIIILILVVIAYVIIKQLG
jgi:ABC-type bacteriocin/lantibiotic exporter with double-glycine peptidase domain